MTASRYDAVPYASFPHPVSNPNRLAVVARLHGLAPADPATSRVVDLGCGDAGNLLAVAAANPGATCVGIDASAAAIERGADLAAAAGVDVELRVADLAALPADLGEFDYVIAQGVLSWVPAAVRDALFAAVERLLAPGGIACLSYHALPGFHLRAAARDVARRRAGTLGDLDARVSRARSGLALVSELHGTEDVYGHVLANESIRYAEREDFVLFHDELAEECTPFAVSDIAAQAGAHGLAYLGEAIWQDMWPWRLDSRRARRVRSAAGADPVARQQLADDVAGAAFKATVFVREGAEAAPEPCAEHVLDLHAALARDAAAGDPAVTPVERVARELAAVAPATLPVREVADRAGLEREAAAKAVLRLIAAGRATLHVGPLPCATVAGDRPEVSPLARAQAALGERVASLRHETVVLEDALARDLLALMDGSRGRAELAVALEAAARRTSMPEDKVARVVAGLDDHLDELARLGLLCAQRPSGLTRRATSHMLTG